MNNQPDLYKLENYTDEQLFRILDLDNPTDRELEAKIHHMIWKYNNFHNEAGEKLTKFFQDIYDRFFDDGEEEHDDGIEIEGMENMDPTPAPAPSQAPGPSSGTSDPSDRNYSYSILILAPSLYPVLYPSSLI